MIRDSMMVGIVVERRDVDHEWIDHSWEAVSIIPGAPPVGEWLELGRGEGWVRYHAATLPIEIFGGETEGYKLNLSLEPPVVFVVLDLDSEDVDPVEVSHVTVCPYEAQGYLDSSESTVETVPMPPLLAAWLAQFVEKHHVDKPFKKRKQRPQREPEEPVNELILPPVLRQGVGRGPR